MSPSFPDEDARTRANMRVRHLATFAHRPSKCANVSQVIDSSDRKNRWQAVPAFAYRLRPGVPYRIGTVSVERRADRFGSAPSRG